MILVTKISGAQYYVNPDLIEYIEEVPGTILCLTNGKHLNILEPPEVVIDQDCYIPAQDLRAGGAAGDPVQRDIKNKRRKLRAARKTAVKQAGKQR